MKNTMLEEYTTNEIQNEIQRETSDDLSLVLAVQKIKENPIKIQWE
jgi:hypothetical protein